ncbi:phosphomevalonate kinase [Alkalibacterium iburiense]|uniref:phosphomevalonate kinase n=1 Tax=Alkalibacterium iburiense TaxID=290589 RepID=A0ABP3H0B6_9LACT
MMKDVQTKAPGKLYIAGEYAVTEPGYPAVLVALDRFIHVQVSPSKREYGTISSPALSEEALKWTRENGQVSLTEEVESADILLSALHTTEQFLLEKGQTLSYYDILIESELTSKSGEKYGLGSSGAVTVAVIEALLASLSYPVSDILLYKLAALAHMKLNSKGSFGDLAAAAYTGWIAYTSFDKEWVQSKQQTHSVSDMVQLDWPLLSIEKLTPPTSLTLLIGWTGSPASTEKLVGSAHAHKKKEPYTAFLTESKACVERLIEAFRTQDKDSLFEEVRRNRKLLQQLSQENHLMIETPLLKTLCEIAEAYHAAAKTSGAGGGDCGIALIDSLQYKETIEGEWKKHAIVPLPFKIYQK